MSSPSIRPSAVRALGVLVALLLLVAVPRAQDFDPARHLPEGAVAVLECAGFDAWADGLGDSWIGRWFAHPRTRRALAGLEGVLARVAVQAGAAAWAATGLDPAHLREDLGGRVVAALWDVDPDRGPRMVVALDARGRGEALLATVRDVFAMSGQEPTEVAGVPGSARIESPEGATLEAALLGRTLVLGMNDALGAVWARWNTPDAPGSLGASPFGALVATELGAARPALRLALDVRALVDRTRAGPGATNPDVLEFLDVSGVGRLAFAGADFAFRPDGSLGQSFVARLDRPAPPEGDLLGAVLAGLAQPVQADALRPLLARLPADAVSVGASRFDVPAIVRGVESVISTRLPGKDEDIARMWEELHDATGLRRDEVLALPAVTMVSASTMPPSGGLMPDSVTLVRDAELDPWWTLAERVLGVFDVPVGERDLGDVRLRAVDWAAGFGDGRLLERAILAELGGGMSDTSDVARAMSTIGAVVSTPVQEIARASLGDGVSVVSMLPQSVERHVRARSGPRLGGDLGRLADERLPGHVAAALVRDTTLAPAIYDTLLAFSGAISPVLGAIGVDSAYLPPAELVGADAPAWHVMTFDVSPQRLAYGGDGPLATPLVLLGAAAAVMLYGAAGAQVVEQSDRAADESAHMDRMRRLHAGLAALARANGGPFPKSRDPVGAFQAIVDAAPPGAWTADDFVSPRSWDSPAWQEVDGRPLLDFWSCSWRMVPWPATLDDPGMLFFDAKPYHDGRRAVCDVDGSLRLLDEVEFLALLKDERNRRMR